MNPYRPHRLMAVPPTLHARAEIAKAIRTLVARDGDDCVRQRSEIAALRRDLEEIPGLLRKAFAEWRRQLQTELRKYSADQPRVPKGNPDGGQWTSEDWNEVPRDRAGNSETSLPPRQYASLDTGVRADATSAPPARVQQGDEPHEQQIKLAADWQSLPVNLVEEEAPNGIGHAIKEHVGKSDAELFAALER